MLVVKQRTKTLRRRHSTESKAEALGVAEQLGVADAAKQRLRPAGARKIRGWQPRTPS